MRKASERRQFEWARAPINGQKMIFFGRWAGAPKRANSTVMNGSLVVGEKTCDNWWGHL